VTAWVITALIIISLVLACTCAALIVFLREQRENVDLLTRTLIQALKRDHDDVQLLPPAGRR